MNKKELIEAMIAKTGSSKAEAERALGALIEVISDTLGKGDSLSLPGFGTFEVRERPERGGRNPKTGEELRIAASKIPHSKQVQRLRPQRTAAESKTGKTVLHKPAER